MTRRLTLIETPPAPTHRGEYDFRERSRARCECDGFCPQHFPYAYAADAAKHRAAL